MKKTLALFLILAASVALKAEDQPATELLLPGGTLYSIGDRTYQSLGLPQGWTVSSAVYSPDAQSLALLLVGSGVPPKIKLTPSQKKIKAPTAPPEGPVTKAVKPWEDSTHLLILNRRTGAVTKSWKLPVTSSATVPGWALKLAESVPAASPTGAAACPQVLSKSVFDGKEVRFIREAAACSTPPEKSDFYRLVRDNEHTHKDAILWEYRVSADTTTCSAQYSCYTGENVQFLSVADQLFLVWDGDLYSLTETDEGMNVQLVTQLLPQFSKPLGIASGRTQLSSLDVASKVIYQPVTTQLYISHRDNPSLYAQNFCPTRSFNAAVEVGSYENNLMAPAGYQVGPVDIGSFKERAYTPLLISVTWTAFHQITDPISCKLPYTVAPHTRGIAVSLTEGDHGKLQCRIQSQED